MDNIIRVYDTNMDKLGYLNNAYDIGYELKLNELNNATFTLPVWDSKNEYCQAFNYVEIFDGGHRVGLFRIMPLKLSRSQSGYYTYDCEHVLSTLLDDVLFKYHQIGSKDIFTAKAIRYVLEQQTVKRWVLGVCDFKNEFEYGWENENLLSALYSIPEMFEGDYKWEFDTVDYPWVLHLRKIDPNFVADITYKKNMTSIEKVVDPTGIVTRLYCLGYGEGDNQLGIGKVNNGKAYIEDSTAIGRWGVKTSILVEPKYESEETLLAYGKKLLSELKEPRKAYTVSAIDLYRKNSEKHAPFVVGDVVRILDSEDGIVEDLPIYNIRKSDITGDVGAIDIQIANKDEDIAGSISELQDRARINDVYAQGATNQMVIPYSDNADTDVPAKIRIFIPESMVRINTCILNYQLEPFRGYVKAARGGGGWADVTEENPTVTPTSISTKARISGLATTIYDMYQTTYIQNGDGSGDTGYASTQSDSAPDHNHGLKDAVNSGAHKHENASHNHYGGTHSHMLAGHSHNVDAEEVKGHTHEVEIEGHKHEVIIDDHTHALDFGVYQGTTASSVTIKVDGKNIPKTTDSDVDIVKYLSVDDQGRIKRNTWHTIEILPDRMTRITANVFMQIFTNSRGGGDY